jgi:hypothetical protein
VVALALTASGGGAVAAAATTTTPAPPTTVALLPPPPRFPLGDDFGRTLKSRRLAALAALQTSTADIDNNVRLVALRTST